MLECVFSSLGPYMLFKQIQLFRFSNANSSFYEQLNEKLLLLQFQPCLPSLPVSAGWVSPVEEENAPMTEQINHRLMICMQIEEKILPAVVVRQALEAKVKEWEIKQDRKLGKKEKNSLKDEVIMNLLPRSFGKISRIYAYIDMKNHWLVLNTTNKKRTEQFLTLLKKTLSDNNIHSIETKKISSILTQWVKHKDSPEAFMIEKKCVLQDINQKSRVIRCQQQDLFVNSIHDFIKDGCEVKQVAVLWRDSVRLNLVDDFTLRSIQFEEELKDQVKDMEAETRQQKFMADFFIMGETLSSLLADLISLFSKTENAINASATSVQKEESGLPLSQ